MAAGFSVMESRVPSLAEDLPALYRAVLDVLVELERRGARTEAARIRREATESYSSAWDDDNRRRLVQLGERARRTLNEMRPRKID